MTAPPLVSLRDALVDFLRRHTSCDSSVIDTSDPGGGNVVDRWGNVACISSAFEGHDGRIRAVFE